MFLKCIRLFYIKDNSVENSVDFIKTRGSQVFNLTSKANRKWGCYTYFESGPPKDHFNSNF